MLEKRLERESKMLRELKVTKWESIMISQGLHGEDDGRTEAAGIRLLSASSSPTGRLLRHSKSFQGTSCHMISCLLSFRVFIDLCSSAVFRTWNRLRNVLIFSLSVVWDACLSSSLNLGCLWCRLPTYLSILAVISLLGDSQKGFKTEDGDERNS